MAAATDRYAHRWLESDVGVAEEPGVGLIDLVELRPKAAVLAGRATAI